MSEAIQYTREECNQHRAQLVKALRSGDYKQTTFALRRDLPEGSLFCCLGVACDLYPHGDWKRFGIGPKSIFMDRLDYSEDGLMPYDVAAYYGFRDGRGILKKRLWIPEYPNAIPISSLAEANDTGVTFGKIADWIEEDRVALALA